MYWRSMHNVDPRDVTGGERLSSSSNSWGVGHPVILELENTGWKKKETDVCRKCDTFEINDRIERLILLITGKTKEESISTSSSQSSDSWFRLATVGSDLISVYYKFLGDYGLGLSRISAKGQDDTKSHNKVLFNGTFLNLGYDYNIGNLILNTNLGLLVSGYAESTTKMYLSDLQIAGSYTVFVMIGYKGTIEYGLGFNNTNFKRESDYYPTSSVETRPVIWLGFNW